MTIVAGRTDLVLWVVNHGRVPGTLVGWVHLGRALPLTTAWGCFTLGVGDLRGLPLTILFLIPVLWLLSFCTTHSASEVTLPGSFPSEQEC